VNGYRATNAKEVVGKTPGSNQRVEKGLEPREWAQVAHGVPVAVFDKGRTVGGAILRQRDSLSTPQSMNVKGNMR